MTSIQIQSSYSSKEVARSVERVVESDNTLPAGGTTFEERKNQGEALDVEKQLKYWQQRARDATQKNFNLNKDKDQLEKVLAVSNRSFNRLERTNIGLMEDIDLLKARRRRSSISANYTISEAEIEDACISEEIKLLLGSNVRSKWCDSFD
jgi:hypothetical protein